MSNLLCKDCIHSRCSKVATFSSYFFEWQAPKSHWYKCAKITSEDKTQIDPVTGPIKIKAKMSYCTIAREHGPCGMEAKYWTPKKKKDIFKFLEKEQHG